MKRTIAAGLLLLGWACTSWGEHPATIATIQEIRALTGAEAAASLPVSVQGVVTYFQMGNVDLFIQDGEFATYVETSGYLNLIPGDRVLVRGKTRASFRTDVVADSVTVLGHGALPEAIDANYKQLIGAEFDARRVKIRATVRSANLITDVGLNSIYLQLLMDGGYIDAAVASADTSVLEGLLDAEVEITGAAAGKFDSRSRMIGALVEAPELSDLKILRHAAMGAGDLPLTPMDEIVKRMNVRDMTQRVRVRGTIVYDQPGSAVILQNGDTSVLIKTHLEKELKIGDLADATGFPEVSDESLTLEMGDVQDRGLPAPVAPIPLSWSQLDSGIHSLDLVSTEGTVLMGMRAAAQDEYVLAAGGHIFAAIFRHPDIGPSQPLVAMRQIPAGSKVRVTGICMPHYGANPFRGPVSFDVLVRDYNDLTVIASPSWLTVRNLGLLAALLLLAVLLVGARGWMLERKVRQQTANLAARIEGEAALERRRSQILEEINGARPLTEILEHITEMVSFMLQGAPCWCEVTNGARVGERPASLADLRVRSEGISAHSGPSLGSLCAAFRAIDAPLEIESEATAAGARLASLAIESRRLYSDLVHRSDFDLLTDIHNRFSLDREMAAQIGEARRNAGVFGLIYIDLDKFKEVNDLYGHQTGDLYLQQVARRMKAQLRPHDLIARLGGDEFAVLVPMVRGRAEVEEIAQRLERSFDESWSHEGIVLRSTASIGIALYPEDGTTRDRLLSAADAAMYKIKHSRQVSLESGAPGQDRGSEPLGQQPTNRD
jgi:diguanylate cyclase (GGDEF)-like protein